MMEGIPKRTYIQKGSQTDGQKGGVMHDLSYPGAVNRVTRTVNTVLSLEK